MRDFVSAVRAHLSLLPLAMILAAWARAETSAKPEHSEAAPTPKLSAAITSVLPKYNPPKKRPPGVTDEPDVNATTDKPRNGIVRLPRYVVREQKVPDFTPMELLTPKGKLELALSRHPGLKFVPFAWLNNAIALEMLAEEQQYARRKQLEELGDDERSFDVLAHDALRVKETGAGGPDHVPVP